MHDSEKEFDLKLRSVLDGVEEEVPQRVWDGVSSRLGRRSTPVAWMRWAGAGLAAAAAVALAVVLSGTFRGSSDCLPPEAGLMAEAPAQTIREVSEEETSGPSAEIPETISSASTRRSHVISEAKPVTPAEEAQAVEETTAGTRTQEPGTPVGEATSKKKTVKENQAWEDPFARMAYEDAHSRSSVKVKSVGFGGLLGTNDGAKPGSHGSGMMGTSGNNRHDGIFEDSESRYGVPASIGIGTRIMFSDRWSISAGVNYSQLSRSFDGYYFNNSDMSIRGRVKNNVRYIGIPVNVIYNVVSNDVFDFYALAGGSVEKCISNSFRIPYSDKDITYKGGHEGLQYSTALGLGVQFNLTDHVGLYIDPSARYWMGKNQPKSIRTQQPFMFNIELGLRFEL